METLTIAVAGDLELNVDPESCTALLRGKETGPSGRLLELKLDMKSTKQLLRSAMQHAEAIGLRPAQTGSFQREVR